MSEIVIREALPGEACLAAHFYYKLFERQFDFLPCTESYFLHAAGEYLEDTEKNRMWVAVWNEKIVGSICIIAVGEKSAQLRLFGTDPITQGKGIGKELLQKALTYCQETGRTHIFLWTIDICRAALHLYEKAGFRMTDQKPNDTWAAYPMTEEKWERYE